MIISDILLTITIFIFIIGLLVFIHEGGHFLAAKRSGIIVQQFAFGFGPKIWGKKWKGTYYRINLIPLGGYVMLLGDQDATSFLRYTTEKYEESDKKYALELLKKAGFDPKTSSYIDVEDFANQQKEKLSETNYKKLQNYITKDYIPNHSGNYDNKPFRSKLLVMVSGVIMNFILGILLFNLYFHITGYFTDLRKLGSPMLIGAETSNPPYLYKLYGDSDKIHENSLIMEANDQIVYTKKEFKEVLDRNYDNPIKLKLFGLSDNNFGYNYAELVLNGSLIASNFDSDLDGKGVQITSIAKDSVAEKIGLQPFDIILEIGQEKITSIEQAISLINDNKGQSVDLLIIDNLGEEIKKNVELPDTEGPALGVGLALNNSYPEGVIRLNYRHNKVLSGFWHSINMSIYNFTGIYELIKQSFAEKSIAPVSSSVSSIFGVSDVIYSLVKIKDFSNIINLAALVSVTLAIMNMLPIPMLDGGHVVFLIIEKVRGRKISQKRLEKIFQIAFYMLIGFSILIIIKDFIQFNFLQRIFNLIGSFFRP